MVLLVGVRDQFCSLKPVQVFQHHHATEQQRAWIDHILVGVLGRSAVCGFEEGDFVADIGARRDADPADFRSQGITEVVAIEIGGRDDIVLARPQQHLLEHDVGDRILDE